MVPPRISTPIIPAPLSAAPIDPPRSSPSEAETLNVNTGEASILRIGMVQMLVEGGKPEANLKRAAAGIREAASQEAKLAVLPECLDLGWTDPSAKGLAQPIPGPNFDILRRVAEDCSLFVVAGLVERCGERTYNSAVLIAPDGRLLWTHRKINELAIARGLYATGGRLGIVETDFGVAGVDICADNLPSSLFLGHSLGRMGAQIILSPSAWAVDADHDNEKDPYEPFWLEPYRELAVTHRMAVVGVSGVGWITAGPWQGRKQIGCSLAVGSDGQVLAQAAYGEGEEHVLTVDVELELHSGRE